MAGKAEISRQQCDEWSQFRKDVLDPLYNSCMAGELKDAKLLADTLKICHEGERKAWLFGEDASSDQLMEVTFQE